MSNFYDKASLVMIPSGTKEGTIFSLKPTNGDGDFTFSRSTSATRVGPSGYIEKETQNLLLQSNQFDTTWTALNASLTSGQNGYDGTNDAWKLTADSTGTFRRLSQTTNQNSVVTSSVYAKAGTADHLYMIPTNGSYSSGGYQFFNLTNGTLGASNFLKIINASIEDVGNGWYRCTIVSQADVSGAAFFGLSNNDTDTTITGGNYIYIQDAQLEQGLVARDYIETTTSAVYGGITDNIPRLDYTDSSCPSLLLEPQRSNVITQSEFYGDYTNFGSTDTANQAISPEGVNNATLIQGDGTQPQIYTRSATITLSSAGAYTFSLFAKKGNNNFIHLSLEGFTGSTNNEAYFDLDNGTTPTSGASIQDYGNGWYRCIMTATIDAGDLVGSLVFRPTPSTSTIFYPSSGDANGKNIYIYGATLEQGSYATSYIPTYGASVTFASDSMQIASGISDLLPQGTGTMYIEATIADAVDTEGYLMRIEQGSFADTIFILRGANGNLGAYYRNGNSTIIFLEKINVADTFKAAFAFESGNSVLYVNGEQVGTSSVTYTPLTTYNDIRIGGYSPSAANMSGVVSQSLVFKTRLSNEELATLTQV